MTKRTKLVPQAHALRVNTAACEERAQRTDRREQHQPDACLPRRLCSSERLLALASSSAPQDVARKRVDEVALLGHLHASKLCRQKSELRACTHDAATTLDRNIGGGDTEKAIRSRCAAARDERRGGGQASVGERSCVGMRRE